MAARLLLLLLAVQVLFGLWVGTWLARDAGWPVPVAVLAGFIAGAGLHALVVAQHFLFAWFAGSPPPDGRRLSIAEAMSIYWRELRDSIITFDFRQPFEGERALASAPGAGSRNALPVVFVHGYCCNRAMWRPLARWLAARGHVTASVNLEPVFGSIDSYPPLIDAAIRDVCERTGFEQVALICHSMGGLAARAYLRAHGDDAVAAVVTLGTPHRGTTLAHFGLGRNVRQMQRDSDWLQALAQSETAASRRLFTIVLSHHDNIVVPQAIQTLADAEVIELSGIGHISLALDPHVWDSFASRLVQ
jgi:triacylglycerol lipase